MKIARSTKNFGKLGFVIDFRTAQLAVSHFYIFLQKSFVLEKNLPGLANLAGFGTKLFWVTIC